MAIWDNVKVISEKITLDEHILYQMLERYRIDPHEWSSRPCKTCEGITLLIGRPFGCYRWGNELRSDAPHAEAQAKRGGASDNDGRG